MKTITLEDHMKQVRECRCLLGITDEMIEEYRNSREHRTLEKRELFRRIGERARESGLIPLSANF